MLILRLLLSGNKYVNISEVVTNCDFERGKLTLYNHDYETYVSIPLKNVIDFTVVDIDPNNLKHGIETLYNKNIITLKEYIKKGDL